MKKSKFTEEPDSWHFKGTETDKSRYEICREHGISQAAFYQRKSKYSGLELNQLKRMKELEAEAVQGVS